MAPLDERLPGARPYRRQAGQFSTAGGRSGLLIGPGAARFRGGVRRDLRATRPPPETSGGSPARRTSSSTFRTVGSVPQVQRRPRATQPDAARLARHAARRRHFGRECCSSSEAEAKAESLVLGATAAAAVDDSRWTGRRSGERRSESSPLGPSTAEATLVPSPLAALWSIRAQDARSDYSMQPMRNL